ncbi:MAG: hypothetical protein PUG48_02050 [Clostridia bacterium]|nr:hypothetical protein [Clostridia bacterium]
MLTEKEKMQRAKVYMLKLSAGINPIDDSNMNEDIVLKNERLSKCFAYVAEVLDGIINGKPVSKKGKKPFSITAEQLTNINIKSDNIPISEFTSEINSVVDDNMKKLQPKIINDWLVQKGYLSNSEDETGHLHRELTEKSSEIGITSKQGMGTFGEYTIILYSEQAQKFILDNLLEIIDENNNAKENDDVQGN